MMKLKNMSLKKQKQKVNPEESPKLRLISKLVTYEILYLTSISN